MAEGQQVSAGGSEERRGSGFPGHRGDNSNPEQRQQFIAVTTASENRLGHPSALAGSDAGDEQPTLDGCSHPRVGRGQRAQAGFGDTAAPFQTAESRGRVSLTLRAGGGSGLPFVKSVTLWTLSSEVQHEVCLREGQEH